MKFEIESKEVKDPEMDVNNESDLCKKDDLIEKTPASSSKLSTTNSNQSTELVSDGIASTSKVEVVFKPEDSGVLTDDFTALKSEDCMVTSTSRSPENILPPEVLNMLTSQKQERETFKAEESNMCKANGSYLKDLDNSVASTSQLNCNKSKNTFDIEDSKSHRQNDHFSSDSSDYESDSSDSSDCDEYFENLRRSVVPAKLPVMKTKGESLTEDLPPVEDLHISVDATELERIGKIKHPIVSEERKEFMVLVDAEANSNPLNEESVLFLSSDNPLGKIDEVIGPVNLPSYVVRFNNEEDILNKNITKGQDVYYAPTNADCTHYVLVDALKQQKGSDASWKDNNEPPIEEIDYSDDEQEKLAKQKRRAKNRRDQNQDDGEVEDVTPSKIGRTYVSYNKERASLVRPARTFQSRTTGPSSSSPRSYSPRSYCQPPSHNFDSSCLPRNAVSPQNFGLTLSNSSPYRQRNAVSPQNFGPTASNSSLFLQRHVSPSHPFLQSAQSPQPFGPIPLSNAPSPQTFVQIPLSNAPSPQPFGQIPLSNTPSPQPFGMLSNINVPPPPNFAPLQHSNVPSPQPFGQLQRNNVPPPQHFGMLPQNNVPSHQQFVLPPCINAPPPQHFGLLPYSNAPSPQTFGQLPPSNVSPPQAFGLLPHSNVPLPQTFGVLPQSNVPSPQTFGVLPNRNVPSPQTFGVLPNRNVPSPQTFGLLPDNNAPSSQPFGQLTHSNVPSSQPFGHFPQSSVSSYQTFTSTPTFVSPSNNLSSFHATGVNQLNSSSQMAAPQNNVPLQQQIQLQGQQEGTKFRNAWSSRRSYQ